MHSVAKRQLCTAGNRPAARKTAHAQRRETATCVMVEDAQLLQCCGHPTCLPHGHAVRVDVGLAGGGVLLQNLGRLRGGADGSTCGRPGAGMWRGGHSEPWGPAERSRQMQMFGIWRQKVAGCSSRISGACRDRRDTEQASTAALRWRSSSWRCGLQSGPQQCHAHCLANNQSKRRVIMVSPANQPNNAMPTVWLAINVHGVSLWRRLPTTPTHQPARVDIAHGAGGVERRPLCHLGQVEVCMGSRTNVASG